MKIKTTAALIVAFVLLYPLTGCDSSTGPSPSAGIHGWAVGGTAEGYATILHTRDGENWNRQGSQATVPPASLISVSAVDSNTVWVAGGAYDGFGVVLKTTDGGENWLRMGSEISIPQATNEIVAVNSTTAWIAGTENSILKTVDGGISWQDISDPLYADYYWSGLHLVSPSNIWVCGKSSSSQGTIIHSTDGGVSWREEADSLAGLFDYMITIKAWDEDNAWVVGSGYSIVRTVDGGDSWELVTPDSAQGSQNDANGITLLSPEEAWVSLDYGNIWHTSDGGENWAFQDSGENGFFLLRICAISSSSAWIGGGSAFGTPSGLIMHTSDGGNTWTKQTDQLSVNIWGVSFAGDMP